MSFVLVQEKDIEELEKQYKFLVDPRVGKLTLERFRSCVQPPLLESIVEGTCIFTSSSAQPWLLARLLAMTLRISTFQESFALSTTIVITKSISRNWFAVYRNVVEPRLPVVCCVSYRIMGFVPEIPKVPFSVSLKAFDVDRDGFLSQEELKLMFEQLLHVRAENSPHLTVRFLD